MFALLAFGALFGFVGLLVAGARGGRDRCACPASASSGTLIAISITGIEPAVHKERESNG